MQLVINNDKFKVPNNKPQSHFYNIMTSRYRQISAFISERLKQPVFQRISDIPQLVTCSVIGTIDKRPNNRNSTIDKIEKDCNDKIFLEDVSGRVLTKGISPMLYITGVTIGVTGILKDHIFHVKKVYEPLIEEIPTKLLDFPLKIAIVSELHINSPDFDLPSARNFFNSLSDISILVVIGSTFCSINTCGDLADDWAIKKDIVDISPMQMLDILFENVKCPKIIIPGVTDPTESYWPQTPLNKLFFHGINEVHPASNPALFSINDINFVCCSGDSVRDIVNETSYSFHESQIMMLRWRLLAPSMPYIIRPNPSMIEDNLVIDEAPNFFICGGSDSFIWSEICGINVISVPSFYQTHTAIFADLKTGDVTSQTFTK
ncbi:hypothetical protein TRFO_25439 [Tritrichomonas foetus]|uniref:DNA polymerase delta small subunit n=1 Tax=Tritrichomonas foetus TaxID=1144522 RepID=A0A1J4K6F6_9EUKA|nr:hypothetical protein TRFO_25439 [Tritrichomonas foetus]|eukprot:OHT06546.1 hypothetical protein TRFO_25439 [Tritrichomonas foetus]